MGLILLVKWVPGGKGEKMVLQKNKSDITNFRKQIQVSNF